MKKNYLHKYFENINTDINSISNLLNISQKEIDFLFLLPNLLKNIIENLVNP